MERMLLTRTTSKSVSISKKWYNFYTTLSPILKSTRILFWWTLCWIWIWCWQRIQQQVWTSPTKTKRSFQNCMRINSIFVMIFADMPIQWPFALWVHTCRNGQVNLWCLLDGNTKLISPILLATGPTFFPSSKNKLSWWKSSRTISSNLWLGIKKRLWLSKSKCGLASNVVKRRLKLKSHSGNSAKISVVSTV